MNHEYQQFLTSKHQRGNASGFDVPASAINPKLFKFQNAIVRWALHLGKAAIFAGTGLGKTGMQAVWAHHVALHTGKPVLILAPLAVGFQTVTEGEKFGVSIAHVRQHSDVDGFSVVVTNYERLHLFDPAVFGGVVLDESSCLKDYTSKTKKQLMLAFQNTPYKLCCTATPAPNDHEEFATHAEFLDVMPRMEMLTRWFIHDSANTAEWRLKRHGEQDFWRWLTSWAVCISKPGDLGPDYDMPEFELPELNLIEHLLGADQETIARAQANGRLMPDTNPSSITLHKVKRDSLANRIQRARQIYETIPPGDSVILWCDTNYEADALIQAFPDAIEVRGSHSPDEKEARLRAFTVGETRVIITKADIAGYGLNWQHCHEMIYVGVNFSFEKLYQSLKRCHRYGQTRAVNAYLIYAETEGSVRTALRTKERQFEKMQQEMNTAMTEHGLFRSQASLQLVESERETITGQGWELHLGDCVEVTAELPDNSIHLSVYSPPFSSLFVYSDSEADMGNCADDDEFFAHYEYLIAELYRVTMPGRLSVVHCSDLPNFKGIQGEISLRDFPGDIIRAHQKQGWVYHSRVTIWKDPVVEMQRTKANGLLHKTFTKDSTAVRQGMPDYLLVFRKFEDGGDKVTQQRQPGDYIGEDAPSDGLWTPQSNAYSIAVWQKYASPVWYDIDQTKTLNAQLARTDKEEKHLAPLQLQVIERCIDLWSMKGETVFTPFAGIGSEVVSAIKMGRNAVGIELKRSYYEWAARYCKEAEMLANRPSLYDLLSEAGIEEPE